jgi:hypothetical protein
MFRKYVKLDKDMCYSKIFFCNDKSKEEWDNLDPQIKRTIEISVQRNLKQFIENMTVKDSIDLLAILYSEIVERLEKLEKHSMKEEEIKDYENE